MQIHTDIIAITASISGVVGFLATAAARVIVWIVWMIVCVSAGSSKSPPVYISQHKGHAAAAVLYDHPSCDMLVVDVAAGVGGPPQLLTFMQMGCTCIVSKLEAAQDR